LGIDRARVYPPNRSHIETLLEQYLFAENLIRAEMRLQENWNVLDLRAPFEGEPKAFIDGVLPPPHSTWCADVLAPWMREPKERYPDVLLPGSVRLISDENLSPIEVAVAGTEQAMTFLKATPHARKHTVDWEVVTPTGAVVTVDDATQEAPDEDHVPQIACSTLVSQIWDGIRALPYSDAQMARCIGTFLALVAHGFDGMSRLHGKVHGIDLTTAGSRTLSWLSESGCCRAIRSDLHALVTPETWTRMEKAERGGEALAILVSPRLLFEFEPFVDVFVSEIVPAQVRIRAEGNLVLFNPARLDTLGHQ
jgi:hypothetical protein